MPLWTADVCPAPALNGETIRVDGGWVSSAGI